MGKLLDEYLAKQPKAVPVPEATGLGGRLKDVGISALKGAIGLPEMVVGLADIPTGGAVGRGLEQVGFKPKQAKDILTAEYSPEQQAAFKAVSDAKGFFPTIGAALQNPSTIGQSIVESAPSMLGAAGIGRGLMKVAPGALGAVGEALGVSAEGLAGAAGEGISGMGSAAEQIRQESPDGAMSPLQALSAIGSGIGTGAFGLVGNKLSKALGIGDVEESLIKGSRLAAGAQEGVESAVKAPGLIKRTLGGALGEGVFEELPQSYQEQVWQNIAANKPWAEGAAEAGAQGALAGGFMGGGMGAITRAPVIPNNKDATNIADPEAPSLDAQIKEAVTPVAPFSDLTQPSNQAPMMSPLSALNGRLMPTEATVQPSLFTPEDVAANAQQIAATTPTPQAPTIQELGQQRFAQADQGTDLVKEYNLLKKEADITNHKAPNFIRATDNQEVYGQKKQNAEIANHALNLFEQTYGNRIGEIAKGRKGRVGATVGQPATFEQPNLFDSMQGQESQATQNARVAKDTFIPSVPATEEEIDSLFTAPEATTTEEVQPELPVTEEAPAEKAPASYDDFFDEEVETASAERKTLGKQGGYTTKQKAEFAAKRLKTRKETTEVVQGEDGNFYVKERRGPVEHVEHSDETIKSVVDTVNKITGGKASLEFVEGKLTRIDSRTGTRVSLKGETAGNLIKLVQSAKDIKEVARHESIHALRNMGLFTDQEWNILKTKANGWIKKFNIDKTYSHLSKEAQLEEAIAHAFEDSSVPKDSLLNRIKDVIEKLWNAIRGRGLQSTKEVIAKVESGEIGQRAWDGGIRDSFSKPALATKSFKDQLANIFSAISRMDDKPAAEDGSIKSIEGNITLNFKDIEKASLKEFVGKYENNYAKKQLTELFSDLTQGILAPITTEKDTVRAFKAIEAYDNAFKQYVEKAAKLDDSFLLKNKLGVKGYGKPLKTVGELREYSSKLSAARAGVEEAFMKGSFTPFLKNLDRLELLGLAPGKFYNRVAIVKAFTFKNLGSVSEVLLPEWLLYTDSLMYKNKEIHEKAWENQVNYYLGSGNAPNESVTKNKLVSAVIDRITGKKPIEIISLDAFGSKERNLTAMAVLRRLQSIDAIAFSEPYGMPLAKAQKDRDVRGSFTFSEFKNNSAVLEHEASLADALETYSEFEAAPTELVEADKQERGAYSNEYGPLEALADIQEVPEVRQKTVADTKGHTEEVPVRTESMNPQGTKDRYVLVVKPDALQRIINQGRSTLTKERKVAYGKAFFEFNQNGDRDTFINKYMDLLASEYDEGDSDSFDTFKSSYQDVRTVNNKQAPVSHSFALNYMTRRLYLNHIGERSENRKETLAKAAQAGAVHAQLYGVWPLSLPEENYVNKIYDFVVGNVPISNKIDDLVMSPEIEQKLENIIREELFDNNAREWKKLIGDIRENQVDKTEREVVRKEHKDVAGRLSRMLLLLSKRHDTIAPASKDVKKIGAPVTQAKRALERYLARINSGFATFEVEAGAAKKLNDYIQAVIENRDWSISKQGQLTKLLKSVYSAFVPLEQFDMYTPVADINLGTVFKDYTNRSSAEKKTIETDYIPKMAQIISGMVGYNVGYNVVDKPRGTVLELYLDPQGNAPTMSGEYTSKFIPDGWTSILNNDPSMSATTIMHIVDTLESVTPEKAYDILDHKITGIIAGNQVQQATEYLRVSKEINEIFDVTAEIAKEIFGIQELQENESIVQDLVNNIYAQIGGNPKQEAAVFNFDIEEETKQERAYRERINKVVAQAIKAESDYLHGYSSDKSTTKIYKNKNTGEIVRVTGLISNFHGKPAVKIRDVKSLTAETRIKYVTDFEKEYTPLQPKKGFEDFDRQQVQLQEFEHAIEGVSNEAQETLKDFLLGDAKLGKIVSETQEAFDALDKTLKELKEKGATPERIKEVKEARTDLIMSKFSKFNFDEEELAKFFSTKFPANGMNTAEYEALVAQELADIASNDPEAMAKRKAIKRVKEIYKNPRLGQEFESILQGLEDAGFITTSVPTSVKANRFSYGRKYVATKKLFKFVLDQKAAEARLGTDKAAIFADAISSNLDEEGKFNLQNFRELKKALPNMKEIFIVKVFKRFFNFAKEFTQVPYFTAMRIKEFMPMMLTSMRKAEFIDKHKDSFRSVVASHFKAIQDLAKDNIEEFKKWDALVEMADAYGAEFDEKRARQQIGYSDATYKLFQDMQNTLNKEMPTKIAMSAASAYMAELQGRYKDESFTEAAFNAIGKHLGSLSKEEVISLAKENMPKSLENNVLGSSLFVKQMLAYNEYLGSVKGEITKVQNWMPRVRRIDKVFVELKDAKNKQVGFRYFKDRESAKEWLDRAIAKDPSIFKYHMPESDVTGKIYDTDAQRLALYSTMDSVQEFSTLESAFDPESSPINANPWFGNKTLTDGKSGGTHLQRRVKDLVVGYDTGNAYNNYVTALERMASSFARLEYGLTQFGNLKALKEQSEKNPLIAKHLETFRRHLVHDLKKATAGEQMAQDLKGLTALWYMGGRLVAPLVNATQPFISGAPELAKHYTNADNGSYAKNVGKAVKDLATWINVAGRDAVANYLQPYEKADKKLGNYMGKGIYAALKATFGEFKEGDVKLPEAHLEALKRFSRTGIMRGMYNDMTFVKDLDDAYFQRDVDNGERSSNLRNFTDEALKIFQITEIVNREGSFLAAFDHFYKTSGDKEVAYRQAQEFVYSTQYMVNKFNTPLAFKDFGPIGTAGYALMSFPFNMVNQLAHHGVGVLNGESHSAKLILTMMGMIFMLGGADALPFKDFIEFMYKHLMPNLAKTIGLKNVSGDLNSDLRRTMNTLKTPQALEDAIMSGVPSFAGVTFSGNLGMKTPIVGGFMSDKGAFESLGGASGGLISKMFKGTGEVLRGDIWKGLENLSPEAIAAVSRSSRMYIKGQQGKSGEPVYFRGQPVKETLSEAALSAVGVKPLSWANKQEARTSEREKLKLWQGRKQLALASGDPAEIVRFNQKVVTAGVAGLVPPILKTPTHKPSAKKTQEQMQEENRTIGY